MTDLATASAPPPGPASPRLRTAFRSALRAAAPALLAYTAVRMLGLLTLAIWAAVAERSPHQLLSARWDSLWYARVADGGYGYTVRLPDGSVHSDLAFFPLLPGLEWLLSAVSPLSFADAGLLVSWVSSLAAAWALYLVGERLYGARAGVCLAVLWAALPVGVVQSMAYSESLFTALAAWALYAVLTERWMTAGCLAALSGLTRPVGAAVVAAVVIAALLWLRRERVAPPPRVVAGVLLAPLGWFGYVAWVGVRTGEVTGYLDIQDGWGNGFDGGWAFSRFIWGHLTDSVIAGLGLVAGVTLVLWLLYLAFRQRQPPPLLMYTTIVVALALCAKGYFGSKPRLLLPAFPLLLPPAAGLAALRTRTAAVVLSALAVASAIYGAAWLHGSGPP
ncbi:glycosyltransferase family 39 protein [Streptomyces sp. AJS327]|uniref:glycosyltransferase family 39 protein n=1 Tax=Streptomyces sp. AJS327 TaxID=2545265 RepID=UPI0027E412B9|nr:glycosyltransferase family 39 protein [Streptomyces sp. AJS327]